MRTLVVMIPTPILGFEVSGLDLEFKELRLGFRASRIRGLGLGV